MKIGSKVFWADPDRGISSGVYTIVKGPLLVTGEQENPNDLFILENDRGSEAEVLRHEIKEIN